MARKRKKATKTAGAKKIATIRHDQKRTNIPTEELRDFVSDDVQEQTQVLYPRNPDLDPQLVWRGKDEQDACDLEVPAVPIYIQEKIHPHAIIEDFKRTAEQATRIRNSRVKSAKRRRRATTTPESGSAASKPLSVGSASSWLSASLSRVSARRV